MIAGTVLRIQPSIGAPEDREMINPLIVGPISYTSKYPQLYPLNCAPIASMTKEDRS